MQSSAAGLAAVKAIGCMSGLGREAVGTGTGEDAKGNGDRCSCLMESSSTRRSSGFLSAGGVFLGAGRSDSPTPAVIPGLVEVKLKSLKMHCLGSRLAKKLQV